MSTELRRSIVAFVGPGRANREPVVDIHPWLAITTRAGKIKMPTRISDASMGRLAKVVNNMVYRRTNCFLSLDFSGWFFGEKDEPAATKLILNSLYKPSELAMAIYCWLPKDWPLHELIDGLSMWLAPNLWRELKVWKSSRQLLGIEPEREER